MDPREVLIALMISLVYTRNMSLHICKKWLSVTLACVALVTFARCSGKSVDQNDPAILYKEAEDDIKSDHYQLAIDKLRNVKNKYPYSKYAVEAQLRLGDVYYMQESYGEAALSYETFRDLHPKHEKVGYAMYRIGLSYYGDVPGNLAKDMTPAQKALDAFSDYLRRFPSNPESDDARKKASELRGLLAGKELYIANFYYRDDEYESAKARYEKILAIYPETDSAKEAQKRMEKVQEKLLEAARKAQKAEQKK